MNPDYDTVEKYHNKSTIVTSDSLSKTKEMLHLVNECKDAGLNTLQNLYDQGDQLTRTHVTLNDTSEHIDKARIHINNINKANDTPCCCLPCVSCFQRNPERITRRSSPVQLRSKLKEEKKEVVPIQNGNENEGRFFNRNYGTKEEDDIESNLIQVSEQLTNLKEIALDMNGETTRQNEQLDIMNNQADKSLAKLDDATRQTKDLADDHQITRSSCCHCSIL